MSVTEKVSVAIGRSELAVAKRLASRLGLSLSSFITDAVRLRSAEQARRDAAQAVLATFAAEDRASAAEARALLALWAGSGKARSKPKSRTLRTAKRRQ